MPASYLEDPVFEQRVSIVSYVAVVDWQLLIDRVEEKTHIPYLSQHDSSVVKCNVKVFFSALKWPVVYL
jgi:hypothetical protein